MIQMVDGGGSIWCFVLALCVTVTIRWIITCLHGWSSHPSLHRNANGIVSPVLLSCWVEDLACLSNFVLQSREPSTSRRARKLYTVVFTIREFVDHVARQWGGGDLWGR